MTKAIRKLLPVLALSMLVAACSSDDDDDSFESPSTPVSFLGDSVTVANTFEDATLTGGAQAIYGLSDPTTVSDPEVELPNYINFYDMDFSANSLTMTLVNNSDAAALLLPEGRFDRYYIGFSANGITSATLDGSAELDEFATVTVLPAGYSLDAGDAFGTGISEPVDFSQGGMMIALGAGTDLSNLGATVKVNYE